MSDLVGIVYFVGAGPGDEGLITVKGAEKLNPAPVCLYRLANFRSSSKSPACAAA